MLLLACLASSTLLVGVHATLSYSGVLSVVLQFGCPHYWASLWGVLSLCRLSFLLDVEVVVDRLVILLTPLPDSLRVTPHCSLELCLYLYLALGLSQVCLIRV
jgi:hypothetical protein